MQNHITRVDTSLVHVHIRIKNDDLEKARQVQAIIEKDCSKHHTYQQLAQLVGTNVTKLQMVFKNVTGKNLYEYLMILRVEKAAALLESTEQTIDAIAAKVGWDRTNLNIQFKKLKGKSPSDWREDQQNNNSLVNELS